MINVDRSTERRNARLQYVIVVLTAAILLYFVFDDKRLYAAMIPPLLLVAGYRSWTVERLSPQLSEYYAHAVVAGAADRMLRELATNRWLHDTWAAAGAPLAGLLALPPERITAGMAALSASGPPRRAMGAIARAVNRTAAVLLGLVLGLALGWSAGRAGWSVLWPVPFGLILLVISRAVVAAYNRGQMARAAHAMRTNTRQELAELLAPPWTDRRVAVVGELRRLPETGPQPVRMPELRVIELLLAAGITAGIAAGSLS